MFILFEYKLIHFNISYPDLKIFILILKTYQPTFQFTLWSVFIYVIDL